MGYSRSIHGVFICIGYVSVMYRLCIGYVSEHIRCKKVTKIVFSAKNLVMSGVFSTFAGKIV